MHNTSGLRTTDPRSLLSLQPFCEHSVQMFLSNWYCTDVPVQLTLYRCSCPTDTVQMLLSNWHCTDVPVQLTLYRCSCPTDTVQMLLSNWHCTDVAVQLTLYRCCCPTDTVQMFLSNWHCTALTVTVGIVTRLRTEQRGVRCSVGARVSSILKTLHTGSVAHSAFWSTGTGFLLLVWSVEREAGRSPPSYCRR